MKYNYIALNENLFDSEESNIEEFIDLMRVLARTSRTGVARYKFFYKEEATAMGEKPHFQELRQVDQLLLEQLPAKYQSWVNVYQQLSKEQKDYLDYYEGIKLQGKRVERKAEEQGIKDLYPTQGAGAISDTNYYIIQKGLQAHQYPSFKTESPKYFENHQVHQQSLINRAGGTAEQNELREIIDKIRSLL